MDRERVGSSHLFLGYHVCFGILLEVGVGGIGVYRCEIFLAGSEKVKLQLGVTCLFVGDTT